MKNNYLRTIDKKQYKKDMEFGSDNEDKVKAILEGYLGFSLNQYKDKFSTFDYYNTDRKTICELKSRRNDDTKYKTQLIGKNKIDKAILRHNEKYDIYFFFKLTNGVYVWKFDPSVELKPVVSGNYARGDKSSDLFLIPNDILTKIEKIEVKETTPQLGKYTLSFD